MRDSSNEALPVAGVYIGTAFRPSFISVLVYNTTPHIDSTLPRRPSPHMSDGFGESHLFVFIYAEGNSLFVLLFVKIGRMIANCQFGIFVMVAIDAIIDAVRSKAGSRIQGNTVSR